MKTSSAGRFFEQLTARVLKLTGSGTQTVAGDGSVIEAAASRFAVMKAEALALAIERSRVAEAEAEGVDAEASRQRLEQLERARAALVPRQAKRRAQGKPSESMQVNVQDPEAVIQPQKGSKHYAASCKPSVLANEARVIVSFAPGSEQRNGGRPGDAGSGAAPGGGEHGAVRCGVLQ